MSFLFTVPSVISAAIVVLAFCALAIVPYFLARKTLASRIDDHTKDLAGSIMFRIGALHSLILALVFAQELVNFNDTRRTMTREAALVGDIFYDLKRYDDAATKPARDHLTEYASVVINREWESLAKTGRLEEAAWDKWKGAYLSILDLVPTTERQETLRDIMIQDVRELSSLRLNREAAALVGTDKLFLLAAIAGVLIMSIAYFPFPPTLTNLILLSLFGVYTGLVMYFIIAFGDPFSGPAYIEPVRFQRLYEGMLKFG